LPDYFRPRRFWQVGWNGVWYLLLYDVPEEKRPYRDTLRRFLRQRRFGCYQKSVWITPTDVRPLFDDLVEGAAVRDYGNLFEARTVLGQPSREIVQQAWDFEGLDRVQRWYCDVYADNLRRLLEGTPSRTVLEHLAREEMNAYAAVMQDDPLLPHALLPTDYMGREVYRLHLDIVKEIGRRF
jgi:phenylacetic acid degradation operon negative regulatory protein